MRITDLLKAVAQPQIIEEDNKKYEFTPGEGGSLIVRGQKKKPLSALEGSKPGTAKVIGPEQMADAGQGS